MRKGVQRKRGVTLKGVNRRFVSEADVYLIRASNEEDSIRLLGKSVAFPLKTIGEKALFPDAGFIHASMVIALVGCSDAEFGTYIWLKPLPLN